MTLKQINTVLAVAESCSFSEAAYKVSYTQSAVSKQVSEVEKELGVKLFQRKASAAVSITPEGEQLLPAFKRISNSYAIFYSELGRIINPQPNNLVIATSTSLSSQITDKLSIRFLHYHPGILVEQAPISGPISTEPLISGKADVLFAIEETSSSIASNLEQHPGISALILDHPPMQMLLPKDHPAIRDGIVSLSDLKGETFIMHGPRDRPPETPGPLLQGFLTCCHAEGFEPIITYKKLRTSTLLAMIAEGAGTTPLLYPPTTLPPNLCTVQLDKEYSYSVFGAYYLTTNRSAALKKLLAFLKEEFSLE